MLSDQRSIGVVGHYLVCGLQSPCIQVFVFLQNGVLPCQYCLVYLAATAVYA